MKPTLDSPAYFASRKWVGTRSTRFRRARRLWMVEQKMRGMSNAEIGAPIGLKERQVKKELAAAERAGLVETVRDKLLEALEKTPIVLTAIMDAPVEELQKNSRGWKLKLDAANSLNTGTGAYRPESHSTQTKITLEGIAAEADTIDVTPDGIERDKYGFPIRKRIAFADGMTIDDDQRDDA